MRKAMIHWGERDLMKMFLPVTEDRMWLQVWLELEGHFAIAEGWDRWVMTSSHLWGKCSDQSSINVCSLSWTYRGLQISLQPCSEQPAVLWIGYEQPWAAIRGSLGDNDVGEIREADYRNCSVFGSHVGHGGRLLWSQGVEVVQTRRNIYLEQGGTSKRGSTLTDSDVLARVCLQVLCDSGSHQYYRLRGHLAFPGEKEQLSLTKFQIEGNRVI